MLQGWAKLCRKVSNFKIKLEGNKNMDRKFEGGPKKTMEEIKEEERKRRLEKVKGIEDIEDIEDKQRERRLEETIEAERGGF